MYLRLLYNLVNQISVVHSISIYLFPFLVNPRVAPMIDQRSTDQGLVES